MIRDVKSVPAKASGKRLYQIRHGGVPVLVVDYRDLRDAGELLDLIASSGEAIQKRPPGSVRLLMLVAGVKFDKSVVNGLKDAGEENAPHVLAVAVVGLTGLLKIMHKQMSRAAGVSIPAFKTSDAALDWLAEQR